MRSYREMMVSAEREGYAGCCEALADWDPGDELAAIRAPTLVIAGSEDPATPPAQGEAIAAAHPRRAAERARRGPGTWPTSSSPRPSTGCCSII